MLIPVRAEEVLPHLELQPKAVLVDPPRAGLERRVLDALLSMHPRQLVYVSCDPAALARDTRTLIEAGWGLSSVAGIDLFPMSHHVESIAVFDR